MGDGALTTFLSIIPMAIMFFGALIVWIMIIVALYRAVKAHESIAESLRRIAEKQ